MPTLELGHLVQQQKQGHGGKGERRPLLAVDLAVGPKRAQHLAWAVDPLGPGNGVGVHLPTQRQGLGDAVHAHLVHDVKLAGAAEDIDDSQQGDQEQETGNAGALHGV